MKYTPQQLLVSHLTPAFLPDLGRLVLQRRKMISAQIEAVKPVGSKSSYLSKLENLYNEREGQKDILDKKHGWQECRPYTLPLLLHLELTIEIAKRLKSPKKNEEIMGVLRWLRDSPQVVKVTPIQPWSNSDFDDPLNTTVLVSRIDKAESVRISLNMTHIMELITVVALDEELEKLWSKIEAFKNEVDTGISKEIDLSKSSKDMAMGGDHSQEGKDDEPIFVDVLNLIVKSEQNYERLKAVKVGLEQTRFINNINDNSFLQIFNGKMLSGSPRVCWLNSSSLNEFGVKQGDGAISFMLYFMYLLYEKYKVVEHPKEAYTNLPNCFSFAGVKFPKQPRATYSNVKKMNHNSEKPKWMQKMDEILFVFSGVSSPRK